MKTFTVQLKDEQQYHYLMALAAEAGIKVIGDDTVGPPLSPLPDTSRLSREELLAIIDKDSDMRSISDPLA